MTSLGGLSLPHQPNNQKQPEVDMGVVKLASVCPFCPADSHTPIQMAVPDKRLSLNAVARCLGCLGYWEVTPSHAIVNVKVVESQKAFKSMVEYKAYVSSLEMK